MVMSQLLNQCLMCATAEPEAFSIHVPVMFIKIIIQSFYRPVRVKFAFYKLHLILLSFDKRPEC